MNISSLGVSGLNIRRKLVLALAAYGVLAFLIWRTLSNEPVQIFDLEVRLRTATLAILGLFVFRTLLYFWRVKIEESKEEHGEVES